MKDDQKKTVDEILEFWFGALTDDDPSASKQTQARWFMPDPEFDRLCTERFLHRHEDAARGLLDDLRSDPRSCLALVLLLDQFPRNMFRNTPRAFATDAKARDVARHAIGAVFDRTLSAVERMFLYLPFEHSENLDDQFESVRLTRALAAEDPDSDAVKYAEQHLEIIQRFGRFPARNAALGRQSTDQELAFLNKQARSDAFTLCARVALRRHRRESVRMRDALRLTSLR
jgi:uncharacterized protein (DUF924 family)